MTDKAYAVPLHEQLASVPRDARLVIDDANGMGTRFIPVGRMCHEAAEALRARLAQPEPEPVAWHDPEAYGNVTVYEKWANENGWLPLYTAPPQREWQGLTDEAVWNLYKNLWMFHPAEEPRLAGDILKFARAIEDKLKEKNT